MTPFHFSMEYHECKDSTIQHFLDWVHWRSFMSVPVWASFYAWHFTCIKSLNPHSNNGRQLPLSSVLNIWDITKVAQILEYLVWIYSLDISSVKYNASHKNLKHILWLHKELTFSFLILINHSKCLVQTLYKPSSDWSLLRINPIVL